MCNHCRSSKTWLTGWISSQYETDITKHADATHCEWCYGWPASPGTSSWSDNRADCSRNNWCYHSPHVCVLQSCCYEWLDLQATWLLVASDLHIGWQTSSNYSSAAVRWQTWSPAFTRIWYVSYTENFSTDINKSLKVSGNSWRITTQFYQTLSIIWHTHNIHGISVSLGDQLSLYW